jgi:hypothetical protein
VIYLVKSAVGNFERRKVIRQTWGFEKRFADVPIRTVFLLGEILELLEVGTYVLKYTGTVYYVVHPHWFQSVLRIRDILVGVHGFNDQKL